jgi:hypothetical protein
MIKIIIKIIDLRIEGKENHLDPYTFHKFEPLYFLN